MKSPSRMSDKERNQWEEIQEQAPKWSMKKIKEEISTLQSKQDLDEGEQVRLESLEWWKEHKEAKPDPDDYEDVTVVKDKRPGFLRKCWDGIIFAVQKIQPWIWAGGAITLVIGLLIGYSMIQLAGALSGAFCILVFYSESLEEGFFSKTKEVLIFGLIAGIPYFFLLAFLGEIHWMYYILWTALGATGLSILAYLFLFLRKLWKQIPSKSFSSKSRAKSLSASLNDSSSQEN